MANIKISGMTAGSALTGTEKFEAIQGATPATVSLTSPQIKTYTTKYDYTYNVPLNGFSLTIAAGIQALILDAGNTIASGTVIMPAAPVDGQMTSVSTAHPITSLTVSPNTGQSIANAPTTLAAGAGFRYLYRAANTTWYRVY